MTSSFGPINALNAFVAQNQVYSEDDEQRLLQHTSITNNMARNINLREIAAYPVQEIVTGQQFFTAGNPQSNRLAYRTTINFGALPNNTTKSVAHGITGIDPGGGNPSTFSFTHIYGTASNQTAGAELFLPIPHINVTTLGSGIQITVDATNVNLTTTANYSAYIGIIVLEYLKN